MYVKDCEPQSPRTWNSWLTSVWINIKFDHVIAIKMKVPKKN